jgi:hypothetical protein
MLIVFASSYYERRSHHKNVVRNDRRSFYYVLAHIEITTVHEVDRLCVCLCVCVCEGDFRSYFRRCI